MVVGVWVALTGSALLIANGLDSPVGEGARDKAQPEAPGAVARSDSPGAVGTPDPGVANLPPFAMVLDHRLPSGIAGLAPAQQAQELRERAMSTRSPERLIELGSVLQLLGDPASAEFSYRSALEFDPQSVAARVGLAMVDGTAGGGLAAVAKRLQGLAAAYPRDQLISFNQAGLELYRGRADAARAALERTVALGATSRLGRTAATLLAASKQVQIGPNP
jgi:tetratricopeptide (TPR) repeat protein